VCHVPCARPAGELSEPASWRAIPTLPPLERADGSGPADHATRVRVCQDGTALFARFDCTDPDVWATHTARDAALWEEEVVELFLAPGPADPRLYAEIEVNPLGTVFDALVRNPHGDRRDMEVDARWDCPDLVAGATIDRRASGWSAWLEIPWRALACLGPQDGVWRANFYRIERPRGGRAEFSCWSPTDTEPPDFHRPARFGRLVL
jgi:Carbohydrate-binding family 9